MNGRRQWEAEKTRRFQKRLLNWYRKNGRALPWRSNPTPYRTWISEIMLQQTQVVSVLPYYERFLARFPDLGSLAKASEKEVLALWSGLGYYGRARNLLKAARQIMEADGIFPSELKKILALPGIGRYTAGAICSIAYNKPQAAVDGNIRRVVARLAGRQGHVPETYFYHQMEAWIPPGEASAFNQAMMDLGATICVPLQPDCPRCPAAEFCEAKRLGIQRGIPPPRKKRIPKHIRLVALVVERKGKTLVTSLNKNCFIPGSWGLPFRIISDSGRPEDVALRLCRKILGREAAPGFCGRVRHSIAHRRIAVYVFCCKADLPLSRLGDAGNFLWTLPSLRSTLLTSSLFHKVLKNAERGWKDSGNRYHGAA